MGTLPEGIKLRPYPLPGRSWLGDEPFDTPLGVKGPTAPRWSCFDCVRTLRYPTITAVTGHLAVVPRRSSSPDRDRNRSRALRRSRGERPSDTRRASRRYDETTPSHVLWAVRRMYSIEPSSATHDRCTRAPSRPTTAGVSPTSRAAPAPVDRDRELATVSGTRSRTILSGRDGVVTGRVSMSGDRRHRLASPGGCFVAVRRSG